MRKIRFKKRKTFLRGNRQVPSLFHFELSGQKNKEEKAKKALRELQELLSDKFPLWTEEEVIEEVKEIRKALKEKNFSKKD